LWELDGVSKQTFLAGALILMAAGMFNRVLGFVPRIMLPRLIGPEGVGLYQMGYPLLILLLTIITGGIPLAVSKLVAEAETEGRRDTSRHILRISLALSFALGLMFTAMCALAARWVTARLFPDDRVYWTFLAMSPIIAVVSVSAVLRGYFQGKHNMIPTAASQVAETVVRCAAVLALAWWMLPRGVEFAAAGAMAGVLCGELAGLTVLLYQFARSSKNAFSIDPADQTEPREGRRRANAFSRGSGLRRLANISIPVTLSKLAGSASYFLESIVIVQSLAAIGIAAHAATAQYGALQGMVIPLLLMPTALTFSLSISLIPALSEAAAKGDSAAIHRRLRQSLRLALLAGAPFAAAMCVLAEPVCLLLYRQADMADMLKWMAPMAVFVYVQAPLQAALQALDRPSTALANTLAGAAVKLALIYVLAARLELGITGAIIAICVNMALVTVLHYVSVARLLGFRGALGDFAKTAAGAVIMAAVCKFLYGFGGEAGMLSSFALAMAGGAAVFAAVMTGAGMLTTESWKKLFRLRPTFRAR